MKGDKKTFIEGNTFYKEHSKNEFLFLKMLHGETGLQIDTTMIDGIQYITMPAGHVISVNTIPKNKVKQVKHIIANNMPFIIKQVALLNGLGVYYSDNLQFLLYNNRLYLIDMDNSFLYQYDTYNNYNNFDLLYNFLNYFSLDYSFIDESLNMLFLFQGDGFSFFEEETRLYKQLNDPSMQKNHVYYSKNKRHIQIEQKNIHVYGKTGNIIITEMLLNPEIREQWELIRII